MVLRYEPLTKDCKGTGENPSLCFGSYNLDPALSYPLQKILRVDPRLGHYFRIVAVFESDVVERDLNGIFRFVAYLYQFHDPLCEGWCSRSIINVPVRNRHFADVLSEGGRSQAVVGFPGFRITQKSRDRIFPRTT